MHVNKTEYSALGMNIMTDDQAERIHNGTMQVLERVGGEDERIKHSIR